MFWFLTDITILPTNFDTVIGSCQGDDKDYSLRKSVIKDDSVFEKHEMNNQVEYEMEQSTASLKGACIPHPPKEPIGGYTNLF